MKIVKTKEDILVYEYGCSFVFETSNSNLGTIEMEIQHTPMIGIPDNILSTSHSFKVENIVGKVMFQTNYSEKVPGYLGGVFTLKIGENFSHNVATDEFENYKDLFCFSGISDESLDEIDQVCPFQSIYGFYHPSKFREVAEVKNFRAVLIVSGRLRRRL